MDSQAKQKATHDMHAKLREFYSGNRVLVRDLRSRSQLTRVFIKHINVQLHAKSKPTLTIACTIVIMHAIPNRAPGRGGGVTPLYKVCAAPKGMVFEPFWSENGYRF